MEGTKVNRFEIGELTFGRMEWHRMAGRGPPSLFNFLDGGEVTRLQSPNSNRKSVVFLPSRTREQNSGQPRPLENEAVILER